MSMHAGMSFSHAVQASTPCKSSIARRVSTPDCLRQASSKGIVTDVQQPEVRQEPERLVQGTTQRIVLQVKLPQVEGQRDVARDLSAQPACGMLWEVIALDNIRQ